LVFDKATFGYSFTTKDKETYVFEETLEFKHSSEFGNNQEN